MRLEDIRAWPHADGHRIEIAWRNPDPDGFPGVRIVRRERTHPVGPDDGVVVAHGTPEPQAIDARGHALHRIADTGLKSDTVYYYALFPFAQDPPDYRIDRGNRAAALATARRDSAGRMYELLPAIYRRYDAEHGQLRSLLRLPGAELDLLYSYARAALRSHDVERVDGRLLPLLGDWIGWKTDFRLEVERQRSELRGAPALYRRVGLIPVVGATVKRISGWDSRAKEFMHNVARSNQPARLNLWGRQLASDGTPILATPDGPPDTLVSLDHAHEGRAAAATDDHNVRWLFYHTQRRGRWRLAYKTSPAFPLDAGLSVALALPDVGRLQRAFAAAGVTLAGDAVVTAVGSLWHIDDATNGESYVVEPAGDALTVYHTTAEPLAPAPQPSLLSPSFAPSRLLDAEDGTDEKYPAAALQGDTLWLLWSSYDRALNRWEVRFRLRRDGVWSDVHDRLWEADTDPVPERRAPAAVVDGGGGLWLFWLERVGRRWRLRYNRHDGSGLDADPATGWELPAGADFPDDGGADPRVESEPFLLFHPAAAGQPLWLFWARREATAPPQTRWTVCYRVKASADPNASDWGAVETLPKPAPEVHDREPAARVDDTDDVLLFWSSDRTDGWSIWRATFDLAGPSWSAAERVTASPYTQRDPLPVPLNGETLLLYRNSESLAYASDVYRATRTVDFRYAGSTTPHTRDAAKLALRGEFEDFQHYTFDARTTNDDWYRRDTVGVYVEPDTMDAPALARGLGRVANVLPEFMPATDRAVLIARPELHVDYAYTYDAPGLEPSFISESYVDALTLPAGDDVLGPDADFGDDFE